MDYDEDRIYYSYQNLHANNRPTRGSNQHPEKDIDDFESGNVNLQAVKRHFREFLRKFFTTFQLLQVCVVEILVVHTFTTVCEYVSNHLSFYTLLLLCVYYAFLLLLQ
jgi:hypothetical protein